MIRACEVFVEYHTGKSSQTKLFIITVTVEETRGYLLMNMDQIAANVAEW